MTNPFPDFLPAESSSIWGDVHAAIGQVCGDGHKLVDETGPAHESESGDEFVVISYHAEDVSCNKDLNISCNFYKPHIYSSETKTHINTNAVMQLFSWGD